MSDVLNNFVPTTDAIERAWLDGLEGRDIQIYKGQFDRWLNRVKDQAFDDGWMARLDEEGEP